MNRRIIPLRQRPVDVAIVAFFLVNLLFITYVVDLEQLVIANPSHFTYPLWPPGPAIDLMHWYGRTFDHDLIARPAWWKVTIWIDDLCFGPFYVVAIYAYVKGKEWIRMPSVIYATILLTNVVIILGDEYAGQYAASNFPVVFLANLAWLVFPFVIIARMWNAEHPFTMPAASAEPPAASAVAAGGREQMEPRP